MRVFFDNVDIRSSSGPNSFGKKLMNSLWERGHTVYTSPSPADVQLSFIQTTQRISPSVALRLDGIYFNTRQDWMAMNGPIKASYESADLVIFQSDFNRRLTEKYFGPNRKSVVINNGSPVKDIEAIPKSQHSDLDRFEEVWCCSSSWRPHKRLRDNVQYFLENRPKNAGLVVFGDNPDYVIKHPDVLYVGKQPWEVCVSVYKRSKKFIHLAFLDHCPNVVVDARVAGCDLVVASSGGTKEIAGLQATVVEDLDWDLRPLDLYSPPSLDFSKTSKNTHDVDVSMTTVADKYIEQLSML